MTTMYAFQGDFRPPHCHPDILGETKVGHWNVDLAVHSGAVDWIVTPAMPYHQYDHSHPFFPPRWSDEYWVRPSYPGLELQGGRLHYATSSAIEHSYSVQQQYSHRGHASTSSSCVSSDYSDRQDTPLSSPTPSLPCFSPGLDRCDIVPFAYGGQQASGDQVGDFGAPCVAMNVVQRYADVQPEQSTFDDEPRPYYASHVHEGYYPMEDSAEQVDGLQEEESGHGNVERVELPHFKRRQPKSQSSLKATRGLNKGTKRTKDKKRSPPHRSTQRPDEDYKQDATNASKAFPCTFVIYGCSGAFSNKNEWKRHVNTQHMRLGYYRCDQCSQGARPNDFNRKDLFVQHIRRMHPVTRSNRAKPSSSRSAKRDPDEQALIDAVHRCWRTSRASPEETGCLFCDQKFIGPGTWDERLEHIGRHMEVFKKESKDTAQPDNWREDVAMEDWLVAENIIKEKNDGYVLSQ